MNYKISSRTLHFRQPAGTSRGIYHTHQVWYIHLSEGSWQGMGECAPLPDLMPGGVFLLLRVRNKEGAESMTHPAPGVPCKGPTAAHQMAGQRYKKLAIYRRSNLLLILSPARTCNALREPETRPLGSVLPK